MSNEKTDLLDGLPIDVSIKIFLENQFYLMIKLLLHHKVSPVIPIPCIKLTKTFHNRDILRQKNEEFNNYHPEDEHFEYYFENAKIKNSERKILALIYIDCAEHYLNQNSPELAKHS